MEPTSPDEPRWARTVAFLTVTALLAVIALLHPASPADESADPPMVLGFE